MKDPDWRSAYDDVSCDNHFLEQTLAEHRMALEALLSSTEANPPQRATPIARYLRLEALRLARKALRHAKSTR